MLEHLHEGLGGAVQNGNFDRVDVDENVVDSAGVDRGEQVLGRGQQHALFHQAGGVADARDVVALRFDRKIVEVDAAKNDAGVGGSGSQTDVAVDSGVESHTLGGRRAQNGGLKHEHEYGSTLSSRVCSCLFHSINNLWTQIRSRAQFAVVNIQQLAYLTCLSGSLLALIVLVRQRTWQASFRFPAASHSFAML